MFLARRWDDTMLLNVFGEDGTTGAPRAQVRDPFDHWSNLSETDNLLVGEFIRKHHPRLAHEMALHGVPGHEAIYLKLDDDLPFPWRDLVGLIARSHGLPLRTSLDYLRETPHFGTTGHRNYQSVHAVYLMALLRVGDYIQIQGDRTSERIFAYKDIPSLVSRVEHKVHLSDILISADTEDPESLQIDASPKEVAVFLRLKEWLAGIQQELDGSWAVLGEVYGRYKELRKLGLAFRRVRSNLDDVKEFAKTVPYVPDRLRFDVARAELLKLLIGPLYGDDPSYGVRELMQNSIDAIREYDQFVLDNSEYADVPRREQEADVVVELGLLDELTGYAEMIISDRGIGMKEEVIRDYFLRAGASFRRSAEWKTTFETDDRAGVKSKVLRSGRFGVGALAAFLIGDEIEVVTRHVSEGKGYSFTTTLGLESISVIHEYSISVGTCIKIKIDANRWHKLLKTNSLVTRPIYWDWYCFNYPTVKRIFYHPKKGRIIADRRYTLSEDLIINSWHRLPLQQPYEVYWTYDHKNAPSLICNGIFVNGGNSIRNVLNETVTRPGGHSTVFYPQVAVIDRDGTFPLNLQRDALRTGEYPFGVEIIKDSFSEMLGWIFFNGPQTLDSSRISKISLYPWLLGSPGRPLIACEQGFGIFCRTLLERQNMKHMIIRSTAELEITLNSQDLLIICDKLIWPERDSLVSLKITNDLDNKVFSRQFESRYIAYRGSYAKKKAPAFLKKVNSATKEVSAKIIVEAQAGPWLLLASEGCPPSSFKIKTWPNAIQKQKRGKEEKIFEERFYPEGARFNILSESWLLDDLWQEHFGKNWIPFALEDRIAKFPEAAQFFKERYPQVVPEEAWALLGGKPA
jgi:hypothetical protein